MTDPEILVNRAAQAAVKQTFAILGVDIDDPKEVEEFREDLRFSKRMRSAADRGWIAMIGAGATIFTAAAIAKIMGE